MKLKESIFFTIVIMVFSSISLVHAEEEFNVELSTNPSTILFHIEEMKPGDYASKTLTVTSNSTGMVGYIVNERFVDGSEKLYDHLTLRISDEHSTLYDGLVKDFQQLESRELKEKDSDVITFTVSMPSELGNDFQGLRTAFELEIYAEGSINSALPSGSKLPNTATAMFQYILIGIILLSVGTAVYLLQVRKTLFRKKKLDIES
ncbi:hypothetical protein [Virgibacillus sp. LDC-1]|uniref:hypothetical protein n=1 Tax=Virgibacillus sp. LDC-1 TaxID=3039856 RepID=UPI0024DEF821|nr:hypothetical protein [Virgibacillus sp. LDC-1]